MERPAAYQEAVRSAPTSAVSGSALVAAKASAEFDSWLSCGFCNHARPETCTFLPDGTLGAIGIDFDAGLPILAWARTTVRSSGWFPAMRQLQHRG